MAYNMATKCLPISIYIRIESIIKSYSVIPDKVGISVYHYISLLDIKIPLGWVKQIIVSCINKL